MVQTHISIRNARSHNLRGVSCQIPLRSLTVITGVSGSGKSTLAFDTLYAEGQRRYVTSLSTYARQFLERLPRPEVDSISHLPPAIAIEQRNRVTNARSTVGTSTEIHDHLRLLFAKIGATHCPGCDLAVATGSVAAVRDRILARYSGMRVSFGALLHSHKGEKQRELRNRLARDGFTRLLDQSGQLVDLTEITLKALWGLRGSALILIDRLALKQDADTRSRVAEAVAAAYAVGDGEFVLVPEQGERATFRDAFACDGCGRVFRAPDPALFSFNSPLGACPTCQGFGRVALLDYQRVVPDSQRSLAEGAIAPFQTPMGKSMQEDLVRACRRLAIPLDLPFAELREEQREQVLEGDEEAGGDWYGVRGFFDWLDGRRYKVQARVLIARYRRFDRCPECRGMRLCPDALCVWLGGSTTAGGRPSLTTAGAPEVAHSQRDARNIGQLTRLSIAELRSWLAALVLSPAEREITARVLPLLEHRLETVDEVGLGYLTLDRQVRTLSGGEAQRIQLATALGGSLTAALYVLDEPSIGLHACDVDRLLRVLQSIRAQGNTVVVVEHAPEVVAAADHVIDLGPGAGRLGGQLVFEGSVTALLASPSSQTARYLRGDLEVLRPARPQRRARGVLRVVGASENNLRNLTVELPLGQLTVVTGVSGAGKSTLIRSVLVGALLGDADAGTCERVEGGAQLSAVIVVDQKPATRSPRSNPATVCKAFDGIRKRFAGTRTAKALGVGPGWFSFNVAGGRCDTCEGAGEIVIDMQFLDDVRVPCDECGGLRYRKEVLEVQLEGRSIVDVLGLTIDEAVSVFAHEPAIAGRLEPLRRVGLGYLTLGQPLSTLSGGEHQRVRLALALAEEQRDALYILDEPTTGLHPVDIQVLLGCLDGLIQLGGTVIVVEHNLDVVRHADFVLDLGPGGGPEGGRLIASGTPDEIARCEESITGRALRAAERKLGSS